LVGSWGECVLQQSIDVCGTGLQNRTVLCVAVSGLYILLTGVNHRGAGRTSPQNLEWALTKIVPSPDFQTRNPAIAEGPRDAGVPVEIW